jgi:hypothetical protein
MMSYRDLVLPRAGRMVPTAEILYRAQRKHREGLRSY